MMNQIHNVGEIKKKCWHLHKPRYLTQSIWKKGKKNLFERTFVIIYNRGLVKMELCAVV